LVDGVQARAKREQSAQKKAAALQKKRLAANKRAAEKVAERRLAEGRNVSEETKARVSSRNQSRVQQPSEEQRDIEATLGGQSLTEGGVLQAAPPTEDQTPIQQSRTQSTSSAFSGGVERPNTPTSGGLVSAARPTSTFQRLRGRAETGFFSSLSRGNIRSGTEFRLAAEETAPILKVRPGSPFETREESGERRDTNFEAFNKQVNQIDNVGANIFKKTGVRDTFATFETAKKIESNERFNRGNLLSSGTAALESSLAGIVVDTLDKPVSSAASIAAFSVVGGAVVAAPVKILSKVAPKLSTIPLVVKTTKAVGFGGLATGVTALDVSKAKTPVEKFQRGVGTAGTFGLIGLTGLALKGQPVRIRAEKSTIKTIKGDIELRSFGLTAKSRSLPLLTTGKPKEAVLLSELSGPLPQPASSLTAKNVRNVLGISTQEKTRIGSGTNILRRLSKDKGRSVKDVVFELEAFQNPRKATKIIETGIAQEGGVLFGSGTTLQLPAGTRSITPKSDIDVIFPTTTKEKLTPRIANIAKELRLSGEAVQVSARNPLIVETPSGLKILEGKSGVGVSSSDDLALTGVLGFDFPNIKAGQIGSTVKFGKIRATKAGEQLSRKIAASLFFRPASAQAPVGFRGAGVFPTGARGIKDIAGAVQQTRGLVQIRKSSVRPIKNIRGRQAEKELETFLGSFNNQQRKSIDKAVADLAGQQSKVKLTSSRQQFSAGTSISPRLAASVTSPSFSPFTVVNSPNLSPRASPRSPSPNIKSSIKSTISKLDSSISKSTSPSQRPNGSGFSGSPSPGRRSPGSPSPSSRSTPSRRTPGSPSPSILSSPKPSGSTKSPRVAKFEDVGLPSERRMRLSLDGDNQPKNKINTYKVEVKEGGKFFRVDNKLYTLEAGLSRGSFIVDNSSAARFRVRRTKQQLSRKSPRLVSKSNNHFIRTREKFREFRIKRGKQSPLVRDFIEKKTFRIDTQGELNGITAKGLLAQKTKKRGRFTII
jgi:hypothetical protein